MNMNPQNGKFKILKKRIKNVKEMIIGRRYFFSFFIHKEGGVKKRIDTDAILKSCFEVKPTMEWGTVWECGSFGKYTLTICDAPQNIHDIFTWDFLDIPEDISNVINSY